MEEFKNNNVSIVFQNLPTPKTASDNLLLQMQGMFAEYERAQITERSRRGKKHKAKNGEVSVLSHAPYGYRYIRGTDGMKSFFEIIDKEASIVKSIFELYVKKRFSIQKIQVYLFNQQIRSPKGNLEWCRSSISGVLNNSAYRGIAYYGKVKKGDPNSTRLPGRSIRINGRRSAPKSYLRTDPKEWIEIPVPAIIENDIFELAQELMQKNKKRSIRNAKPGSLLQGLICCAECGYSFITTISGKKTNGYRYYRCSKRDKKCTNPGIRTEVLDEAIWESLISILKSPGLIQKEVSRRVLELEKAPIRQRQKLLKSKLEKLEREANLLLDAYQSECIDLRELKNRMSVLKKEKNNLIREINEIDTGLSKKQLLELTEAVTYFSSHLEDSQKELDFEEKRKVLRMLIEEIQIGKEGVIVNHIVPIKKKAPFEKIARLHTGCKDAMAQRILQAIDNSLNAIFYPTFRTRDVQKTQPFNPQRNKKCSEYLKICLRFFTALRIKILHFLNVSGAECGFYGGLTKINQKPELYTRLPSFS